MSITHQSVTPCLWFDHQAEEAARFYVSVFPNSRITRVSRYSKAGQETHKRPAGSVMVVAFELDGRRFTALNGGPLFPFTPAVSFQVNCDTQEEIDRYWGALSEGGDPLAQQCGWLSDRYGLSWQIVPAGLAPMLEDHESGAAERVMTALLAMKRIDLAAVHRAFAG